MTLDDVEALAETYEGHSQACRELEAPDEDTGAFAVIAAALRLMVADRRMPGRHMLPEYETRRDALVLAREACDRLITQEGEA